MKQLRAAGAAKIFKEAASGAKTGRAQLRRVLAQFGKGDVLTVTRLGRRSGFPLGLSGRVLE